MADDAKGWDRLDPELSPMRRLLPQEALDDTNLAAARAVLAGRGAPAGDSTAEQRQIPGPEGAPDVAVRIYRPSATRGSQPRGVIFHMHGGSMVLGTAAMADRTMPALADALDVVALSVDYRLAPETRFPGPLEDCHAALVWLAHEAEALGIDPQRIVLMGESSGGGLAAALAQMARDRGTVRAAGQVLVYPMLDYRTGGPDDVWRNPVAAEFAWMPVRNQFGWRALRGDYDAADHRRGWFSPALAERLDDLPPTFLMVGSLDLYMDEGLDYARRLAAAGVAVECHVYPRAIHAFNVVADARVSRQAKRDLMEALARMVG